MASTITAVNAGQIITTDKCVLEAFAGTLTAAGTYKLVLLDIANQGALTLSQAATVYWSDLSDAETNTKSDGSATPSGYTKGTGLDLTTPAITSISNHMAALDFDAISLDNADLRTDAYAIVRWVSTTANSPVLALGKFDGVKTPSGTGTGNFTVAIANPIKLTAGAAA